MRRFLLPGCLMLALASVASTQVTTPDDALSPMEQLAGTPPSAAPKPDAAKPDAAKAEAGKADAAKKTDRAAKPEAERRRDELAQCLRDWDRATHMTRQEWNRTCRRVVSARSKLGIPPEK